MSGTEEVAVREWANGLAGVTPQQIERGLSSWRELWPPTLYQFREACVGSRHAAHRPFPKALPRPKAKPEVAQAELARMRQRRKFTPEEIDAERAALKEPRR